MPAKTPLGLVKEQFGDKAKLVEAVEKFTSDDLWVARTNKDKGLAHVSNAKLLRLHSTFSLVKEKFVTRAKLIESILELMKCSKDAGYKHRLEAYPVPRLYDLYKSTEKRIKAAAKAAEPKRATKARAAAPATPAKKAAATKKAVASKPAAKKDAAKKSAKK